MSSFFNTYERNLGKIGEKLGEDKSKE